MSLKQKIIQICKDFSNEIGKDNGDDIYDFGKVVIARNNGRDYVYLKSNFIVSLLHEATRQIQEQDFDGYVEEDDKLETHVRLVRLKDVLCVLGGEEK